jgi:hypothetical protein
MKYEISINIKDAGAAQAFEEAVNKQVSELRNNPRKNSRKIAALYEASRLILPESVESVVATLIMNDMPDGDDTETETTAGVQGYIALLASIAPAFVTVKAIEEHDAGAADESGDEEEELALVEAIHRLFPTAAGASLETFRDADGVVYQRTAIIDY